MRAGGVQLALQLHDTGFDDDATRPERRIAIPRRQDAADAGPTATVLAVEPATAPSGLAASARDPLEHVLQIAALMPCARRADAAELRFEIHRRAVIVPTASVDLNLSTRRQRSERKRR